MFGRRRKKTVYLTTPGAKFDDLGSIWGEVNRRLSKYNVEMRPGRLKKVPQTADLVIVANLYAEKGTLPLIKKFPKERLALCVWEPPTVDPSNHNPEYRKLFGHVLTMYEQQADGKSSFYFRGPYPVVPIPDEIPFTKKKLVAMVVGNKSSSDINELYSERRRVIDYFEENAPQDFDFWGYGWEHCGYQTYKGTTPSPQAALKDYRFSICYENTKNMDGYITEKIFCSFNAKCVPVYLGAPNIESYIPKECFIRREDFASLPELHAYLKNMKEEEYQRYLDAVKTFAASEAGQKYSNEHFIEEHTNHILRMLGLNAQAS